MNLLCPLCQSEVESSSHLFFSSPSLIRYGNAAIVGIAFNKHCRVTSWTISGNTVVQHVLDSVILKSWSWIKAIGFTFPFISGKLCLCSVLILLGNVELAGLGFHLWWSLSLGTFPWTKIGFCYKCCGLRVLFGARLFVGFVWRGSLCNGHGCLFFNLVKSNMLRQPFTRQDNTAIQTCVLASSA